MPVDTDSSVNNLLYNCDENSCNAEPDAREKKQVIEVVLQREGTKGTISFCRLCFEKPLGQYSRSTATNVSRLREEYHDSKTSKKLSNSMFVERYPGKFRKQMEQKASEKA